jgi:hypothetical protein
MNLTQLLAEMLRKLDDIKDLEAFDILAEAKGHLDHPEDLVFLDGIQGAQRAIDAIVNTVKSPKTVTIKWDGYPALIFGRGTNGKFAIMDKHMFNKKDMSGRAVYSPEQFVQYDMSRGVDRSNLHQLIGNLWSGLEKASAGAKGYYWGDLLFGQKLEPKNNMYSFRANPNGIAYQVDASSDLGKLIANKTAAIAVHQFIPPNAASTDDATPLDGTIGQLKNNSNVAIVPSKMPNTPALKINTTLVNNAKKAISQYGTVAEQLMSTAPQARNTFNQLFTTYINRKIVSGDLNNLVDDFMEFVQTRTMTESMRQKIMNHLSENTEGIVGIFSIWIAIYNLKMDIVAQLNRAAEDSPVKGYLQDGTQTQEGFVAQGLKFVDRMGFSRQNLAGR